MAEPQVQEEKPGEDEGTELNYHSYLMVTTVFSPNWWGIEGGGGGNSAGTFFLGPWGFPIGPWWPLVDENRKANQYSEKGGGGGGVGSYVCAGWINFSWKLRGCWGWNFSVPGQQRLNFSVSRQERLNFSVPGQEELNFSVPGQERLNVSVLRQERLDDSVPGQERLNV